MKPVDFKTVIPRARAGDLAAHNELMAAFYAWTVSEAKKVVRDSELAKDVAVDFWAWLRKKRGGLRTYKGDGALFFSWMRKGIALRAKAALRVEKRKLGRWTHEPQDE